MECWREESVEWAAIRIVDGDASPEIAAFLAHARSCVRCRELLALFRDGERMLRVELSVPKVLPLSPVRPTRAEGSGRSLTPEEFELAAETSRPAQSSVLTLTTEDGSFLVRVFPQAPQGGATAVLVASAEGGAHVALRIGDIDYPFDDKGISEIPNFPAPGISLVIR